MSNHAPCEKHADAGFAEGRATVPAKEQLGGIADARPPPLPSAGGLFLSAAYDYGMAGMNLDSASAAPFRGNPRLQMGSGNHLANARIAGLARCGMAVRWRSIFVMAEGQRPHPRRADRRGVRLEDASARLTGQNLSPRSVRVGGDDRVRTQCISLLVPSEEAADCNHQHDAGEANRKLHRNVVADGGQQDLAEHREEVSLPQTQNG
jgi:hypothetical protein